VTIRLALQIPNFSYGTPVAELFPTAPKDLAAATTFIVEVAGAPPEDEAVGDATPQDHTGQGKTS
jgi:hypothetical protein